MSLSKLFQQHGLDAVKRGADNYKFVPLQSQFKPMASVKSTNLVGVTPGSRRVLKQFTLHQLKVFEAVAQYCSFTRAAKELYLTQPTVSMQIKQLTDVVGMPLFEQVGKRMSLTEAGRELLTTCHEVFEQLTQFEMRIADMKCMKHGHLKIVAISPINYFISRWLDPFYHRYPGISISLNVMNNEQILKRLSENTDDLYLMSEPPVEPDIYSQPFFENPLVVVASTNHPLATETHIPIARLNREQFVMREIGSATRHAVQTLFNQHGMSVRVQLEVGNNEAIKQIVMYGLGISVLSYHMVATEVANGQLTILDVEGFPINRNWYVVYPLSKQLPIVASTFLQFLESEVNNSAVLTA